jgi:hypothetical protein
MLGERKSILEINETERNCFHFFPIFPASEGKMAKKYYATRWWKLGPKLADGVSTFSGGENKLVSN